MRAVRLVARGFRNLTDLELDLPPTGAVFLGPNGHGKTSVLEALYYPVLFRSLRGAADVEVGRWNGPGFHVGLTVNGEGHTFQLGARFTRGDQRRRAVVDGQDVSRLTDAIGHWLAVAFLPTDLRLVQGPAAERRAYLDRVLSLADASYLRALLRYRAALSQRNAALRQGRPDQARAFDPALAAAGAPVMRARQQWVAETREAYAAECEAAGEAAAVSLAYRGDDALVEEAAWPAALDGAAARELVRGATRVGPHRDDLTLRLAGHDLRRYGSTGQQRIAAVALKLCELATLARRRGTEPALLLDDVFAELDGARQASLAERLRSASRQVFVTAPRRDELPDTLDLPVFEIREGRVQFGVAV